MKQIAPHAVLLNVVNRHTVVIFEYDAAVLTKQETCNRVSHSSLFIVCISVWISWDYKINKCLLFESSVSLFLDFCIYNTYH